MEAKNITVDKDPDPYQSELSDSDPRQSEKRDPDHNVSDPQH